MLKKLFYYEWRDSWKTVGCLNGAVILLSLLSCLMYRRSVLERLEENSGLALTFGLYNFLYFAVIMALAVVCGYFFFYRFYRNLYTDEGYLMHTLPVSTHQMIWSKAFVAVIWRTISVLIMAIAFLIFVNNALATEGDSVWRAINELIGELARADIPSSVAGIIALFILLLLIMPFYSLFLGYLAISLGQLTKKHKLLASVVIYFAISYGIQIIFSICSAPFVKFVDQLDYVTEDQAIFQVTMVMLVMVLVFAGITVLSYYLTNRIMKNKLNLE